MRPNDPSAKTYSYIGADAKRIDGGWESLGDMGAIDADGYVYLADRQTDMILAGGSNVYPAEVEAAIDEHPRVRSCAVIGLPDDDLGSRIHAIVHTDDGTPIDVDELRAHLAERLVRYKIPRDFEFTDRAPARRRGQAPPVGVARRTTTIELERVLPPGGAHGDRRFRRLRRRQPLLRGHRLVHPPSARAATPRSCSGPRSAASSG